MLPHRLYINKYVSIKIIKIEPKIKQYATCMEMR